MSDIEATTTGEVQETVQTPDAGENKKSFDELIEGDYRREYGEKVEAIVKNRLKNHTETKAKLSELTDMIVTLAKDMGMDSSDPREIITRIASKKGEAETKADGTFSQEETTDVTAPSLDPDVISQVNSIADRVRAAKEYYPDLDIAYELKDPEFAALFRAAGNDPKRAYEMKYHDRILTNAMKYAVSLTESRIANTLAAKTARPTENASLGTSGVTVSSDPKSLTKAQRTEIKKRVRRGERILW